MQVRLPRPGVSCLRDPQTQPPRTWPVATYRVAPTLTDVAMPVLPAGGVYGTLLTPLLPFYLPENQDTLVTEGNKTRMKETEAPAT